MTENFGSENGNWVEAPQNLSVEEAVKFMAEQGTVSAKPVRHRSAKKSEAGLETKAGLECEAGLEDEKIPRRIFAGTAADAHDFLEQFENFSFVYHAQNWWQFGTDGWEVVSESDMEFKLAAWMRRRMMKLTRTTAADRLFAMNSFCNLHISSKTFEPAWFLSQTPDGIQARHAPGWIACQNALIHAPTVARALYLGNPIPPEAVKPADSSLFVQGKVPANFNPNAVCPFWTAFVKEACPEDGPMLQEMFGLSLTYDRSFNAFFVIYGASGTGKSTCLNVLQKLNEGSVSQVSLGRFGERFFIWPLAQNRVNIVHDMDSIYEGDGSVSLREAVLKSVASGESIEVERKHRQAQREHLRALCVFGTNTLPRFADKSNAIAQRMRIIQFPNVFRGTEKQVRAIHETFYEELDGILLWALAGYGELLESGRNGIWESESSWALKEEAIKDSRPEILFCDEMLEKVDFLDWKPSLDIYKAYEKFCFERGYKAAGMNKVIPLIVEYLGGERKRVRFNGRQFQGVRGIRLNENEI